MSIPYVTGTVSVANGNAVVTGAGTAWTTAVLNGGLFGLDGSDGNPIPILKIDSDTQLTLAKPWRGATGAGQGYWIQRDTAYGQQTVANAQALSTYLQRLDNASLSALASLAASMSADKFAYATGLNTMAWAALSVFNREMLALGDAAAVRGKIGAYSSGGGTITGSVGVPNGGVIAGGSMIGGGLFSVSAAGSSGTVGLRVGNPMAGHAARWQMVRTAGAETGGDVGSDFGIERFSDTEAWLGHSLFISRKYGLVQTPQNALCQISPGFGAITLNAGQQIGWAGDATGFSLLRGAPNCLFTIGGNPGSGGRVVHVPVNGLYRIHANIVAANAGGTVDVGLNGGGFYPLRVPSNNYATLGMEYVLSMAAGDYLSIKCSYGPVNILFSECWMSVELLQLN